MKNNMEPIPVSTESQTGSNHGLIVLLAATISLFFSAFMASGINVAIPLINEEFQADAILLSWVVTAQLLTIGIFQIPFGRLADIYGIKKIFLWGMILYTLVTAVAIFSNSIIMIIVCRALQGIGSAMVFTTGMAMVTAAYPANQRGRVLGMLTTSVYIGYTAGPFLGGILTEYLGWRSLFVVNVPAGLLVVFLILWKVKGEWALSRGEKFDAAGSVICGLALVALIYGFSLLPDVSGIAATTAGIIGIVIFLKWEGRAGSPLLDLKVFRDNRTLLFSNLATLISYCSTYALTFLLSLYLQYIKALTPEQTGIVLLAQPLMLAVFASFTGRLSDKIEPRVVASIGMALIFIGLVFFCFLNRDYPMVLIIIALLLIGLGMVLFIPPNTNAVMSSITPKYFGIASATNSTMRAVGQMLSMGITTVVMALIIGRVTITPDYYPAFLASVRVSFAIFSILCIAGILTSLARGKIR